MRIISGKNKGKRILAPKDLPVRPTTDMAKEALCSILNNHYYFEEINFLDLFAGTGNLSYEMYSRGAMSVHAVDAFAPCIAFINKTASLLGYDIRTTKADVMSFLAKSGQSYRVIFADPPYTFTPEELSKIVEMVFSGGWLCEDGLLVVEHSERTSLAHLPQFSFSKRYGGTMFSFFAHQYPTQD